MLATKQGREAARGNAAFRARSKQLNFAYARLVIGDLTDDRRVVRIATAVAILHTAGHPARIRRLGCERNWRRDGSD